MGSWHSTTELRPRKSLSGNDLLYKKTAACCASQMKEPSALPNAKLYLKGPTPQNTTRPKCRRRESSSFRFAKLWIRNDLRSHAGPNQGGEWSRLLVITIGLEVELPQVALGVFAANGMVPSEDELSDVGDQQMPIGKHLAGLLLVHAQRNGLMGVPKPRKVDEALPLIRLHQEVRSRATPHELIDPRLAEVAHRP